MRWWTFLTAIAVGAVIGGLGALLRDEPVTIGPLSSIALASEQSFLNGVAQQTAPVSAFSRVVFVDVAGEGPGTYAGERSPPVVAADRRIIAQYLNTIRHLSGRPRLVVLDVDIAPLANAAGIAPADEESVLVDALSRWRADTNAPPLLLVRGEGCGPPVSHATSRVPVRWRSTPYDSMVAPMSNGATPIAWACALPSPSIDGAIRRFHPAGCVSRRDDWSERFPVPSPGEWAVAGLKGTATPDFARIYSMLQNNLASLCQQESAGGTVARPMPLVQKYGEDTNPSIFGRADLSPSRPPDFSGALVLIGRFDSRAGDLWVGSGGKRVPGPQLIAAQIDTALRFRRGAALGVVEGTSLAFGLGAVLGAIYWTIRSLRKPVIDWLGAQRLRRNFRLVARLVLSAPALGFALTTATTFLLVKIARFVPPGSWPILWYVAVGCGLALALLDMALNEEDA